MILCQKTDESVELLQYRSDEDLSASKNAVTLCTRNRTEVDPFG